LPPTEQFLSFDRLWEVYERETPLGDGEYLWEYQPVNEQLDRRIRDVSWAAYKAVGGRGYGRVDLRMDAASGELYVLEVNAQCGLSEDENYTSIGAILRFANRSFSGLVTEILNDARS
jgi:D-alanine-D-alanine ligase